MSLGLDSGTKPEGLSVNTFGDGRTVHLGGRGISVDFSLFDFLCTVYYVLTNTNLIKDDDRLDFIKCVKSISKDGKKLKCHIPCRFKFPIE